MQEKIYTAKVFFDPISFPVYNCDTDDEANKRAFEIAIDLAECCGNGLSVDVVEVSQNK